MTNDESVNDIRKALTWIDRRQIYGVVAALLGYGAWLFSLGRVMTLVRGTTALPDDLRAVLEAAAIFVVLSAMATQFMICSYLTVMTRRVLRAIHLSAISRGVTASAVTEPVDRASNQATP